MVGKIKAMPLGQSLLFFGFPAFLFWLLTLFLTPYLSGSAGLHQAMSWFITGFVIFVPLFFAAFWFSWKEGNAASFGSLRRRLRLKRISGREWAWALGGLAAVFALTGVIMGVSTLLSRHLGLPVLKTTPVFLEFRPFGAGERWMLLVWFTMFFFNIVGEEIFWRGYILPRQELANGRQAWVVNSILWGVFHLCFGWDLLILLMPVFIILPYAVYKTKNTLVGIFIHGLYNGPLFVLVSLGIVD